MSSAVSEICPYMDANNGRGTIKKHSSCTHVCGPSSKNIGEKGLLRVFPCSPVISTPCKAVMDRPLNLGAGIPVFLAS